MAAEDTRASTWRAFEHGTPANWCDTTNSVRHHPLFSVFLTPVQPPVLPSFWFCNAAVRKALLDFDSELKVWHKIRDNDVGESSSTFETKSETMTAADIWQHSGRKFRQNMTIVDQPASIAMRWPDKMKALTGQCNRRKLKCWSCALPTFLLPAIQI